MFRRLFTFLALLFVSALAQAQHITPQLVAEGPAPAGGEVELAIHMRPEAGWHGYWLNPGDAGLPMDVQWHLPSGFSAGQLRYPVPTRLEIANLMNYVYEHDYAVLVRLKVPEGARGTIPVRADARWLACTDKICVPEHGQLSLDLPVGSGTPNRVQFDSWRQALPQPIATIGRFEALGKTLRVAIPLPASVAVDKPYVFPITDGPVDYEAKQGFRRSGDLLIAELQRKGPVAKDFSGVIALGNGRGLEFQALAGPVPEGTPLGSSFAAGALLWAVLGAIAGGILLNLMPCVFPILALKALHLSRAGGETKHVRSDALAYTAGAIAGTGALGAILLAIRAAGVEAGWAFQLQDPRTIAILLLLAVAITANLVGLFELPVLGGSARPAGSFGTGALAAFVATPCAGPFLGAALGTALLLPAAGSVLVFAALGFGLALPFVFVAFVPAARRRLPKPGAWMQRLQRILAIPMGATALAALWLLNRQAGMTALLLGVAAGAGLLLLLYAAGRRQRGGKRILWALPAALALSALLVIVVPPSSTATARPVAGADPWSEAAVAQARAAQRPVFVFFTADWCLSCKVNEAAAIDRDEVRDAFKAANVEVLAGDWTKGDPAITRFLESRGRAGVPYYLWYAPGRSPEELPQVLTPGMLISRARSFETRPSPGSSRGSVRSSG
jgi:DsbC/DsbD-like thiol-disulfide interchange protein/cytochrome c biogenesis protein CcdA